MTWPRFVVGGSYCFVTRRCAQRKFYLKPSKRGNAAFEYCLALAAKRTGVQVLFYTVMSNHYHLGLFDPRGRVSDTVRELNRLVAKHHNTMYGRNENLFSSEKFSCVRLCSPVDVLRRLMYTLENPVKDNLVDKASHWPGAISLPRDLATTKVLERPKLYFSENGSMPETIELELHKPECFASMTDEAYRAWIDKLLTAREGHRREQRLHRGIKVLGRKAVLTQHHEDSPKSREAWFKLNPRVGAANKWQRIEAIQRLKQFLREYAEAWQRWMGGERDVEFPFGTYWMRIKHGARCAGPPEGFVAFAFA